MSYDSFESSVEASRPVELYRIVQGGSTWEFTNADRELVVAALTYSPESVERAPIEQGPEDDKAILNVTIRSDHPFALRFAPSTPGSLAFLTIQRYQFGDGGTPEVITIYEGKVTSVSFEEDEMVAVLAIIPEQAAASRPIPRFTYQNLCNHVLYDTGCKVDETDSRFRLTANVTAFDPATNTATVPGAGAFGADWWVGGFMEISGGDDVRMILDQTGDDLQLLLPFPTPIVGSSVTILAGCDHTIDTCDSKFDTPEDTLSNVINYGGFAFVPIKNPYQGLD